MPGRNAQVSRTLRILSMLDGVKYGLTVDEITEQLCTMGHDVSKRTVYRDLLGLQKAGFGLIEKGVSETQGIKWMLDEDTRIQRLAMSMDELFALSFARITLSPFETIPFRKNVDSAFLKVEEKLSAQQRKYVKQIREEFKFETGTKWAVGIKEKTLDAIRAACEEGHVLNIDYESSHSRSRRQREVGPHYLYVAKGSLYLVAEDLEDNMVKIFSVPRIHSAEMTDKPYAGEKLEPEKFFGQSFGVFRNTNAVSVKISFDRSVAAYVKERQWHASQKIKALPDGRLEMSLEVAITPDFVQWILGFGSHVKAVSPPILAGKIKEEAGRIVSLY